MRGDTGTPVNIPSPRALAPAASPSATIAPLILGDSLARGAGDETGLGIGGRLVQELRARHIPTQNIVNLGIDGARTPDLLAQLQNANVQRLLAQSNVIVVSIGGNDLNGGIGWRGGPMPEPEKVTVRVLDQVTRAVRQIRSASPRARIFIIGLYNPYASTPVGQALGPLIADWNAKLVEQFAHDPNVVVVQTADLFRWHDRLSLDRFHPGNEGYALIARRIADAL